MRGSRKVGGYRCNDRGGLERDGWGGRGRVVGGRVVARRDRVGRGRLGKLFALEVSGTPGAGAGPVATFATRCGWLRRCGFLFWERVRSGIGTGWTVLNGFDDLLFVLCLELFSIAHGFDVHWGTSAIFHAGERRGATELCDGIGALLCG